MRTAPTETAGLADDPLVRDLVDRVVAEADPLRVILFGSRATGAARPDSDVDLLVVLPDGTDRRRAMARISSRLPILDVDVDVLVATPEVLARHADNPGLIYRQALRTGRDVYLAPGHQPVRPVPPLRGFLSAYAPGETPSTHALDRGIGREVGRLDARSGRPTDGEG